MDQKVVTLLGGTGRVELIRYGVDGITYFVNGRWFKERDLKSATTELTEG